MLSYANCHLCPRECGVNRSAGNVGFCGMTDKLRVARASLHHWEEPCISGHFGSGTVFFSGCALRCGFCQNCEISQENLGAELTVSQLRDLFLRLIDAGAENINLVTPSHFLPSIIPALSPKLPVPVVYNCGGYERVETLKMLEGLVDIYLPDLKYSDPDLAKTASFAGDYVECAQQAIMEMYRQTGSAVLEDGMMKKGVLIRHLVLPDHVSNSLGVVDWVSETFTRGEVLFSLMRQFTPAGRLKDVPPFHRGVTEEEYAAVRSWMELCGIKEGYFQEDSAADGAYIPQFYGTFEEILQDL